MTGSYTPPMIAVALKEWARIVDLLVEGRQAMVLRKGGVHEEAGPGRFELAHDRFALFPAWEHQRPEWIKSDWRGEAQAMAEPDTLTLRGLAEVARIWAVPSREAFDTLDDLHGWERPQIDMRFDYKPDRPLYVVALRTYRLPEPATIPNRPRYAGCKSWVDLEAEDAVDEAGATPTMGEAEFGALLARVDRAMTGGC